MSADETMTLVEIGPALIILGLILAPFAIRAAIEDFRDLAHLIDPPKTPNDRKEAHR